MHILSDDKHIARKRHRCDSCCGSIEPGEEYERQALIDEGELRSYKAHARCIEASRLLWSAGIFGPDDTLLNVSDMDWEDRTVVYSADPQIYYQCWPGAHAPSRPKLAITR